MHAGRDSAVLRLVASVMGARWMLGMENGNEGMFGGPAWWAGDRPVHGAMWIAYALSGDNKFLYLDTAYGVYKWFVHVHTKTR
tara:strand:- start:243 stop:491 length:249 start_codon:yes stop_codon:yes gene_type:complete